jgi:hypothetical protein
MEDIYVDQAFRTVGFGDRVITSSYTPHGIRCIDSQYCKLILNLHRNIKNVFHINRRKAIFSSVNTRKVEESYDYYTFYDKIEMSQCNGYLEIRIEWDNGEIGDFFYGTTPTFDLKTKNINPKQLKKEIKNNPHLHKMIKDNLLSNINTR